MKEANYLLVQDLTRVRIAREVLREVLPGGSLLRQIDIRRLQTILAAAEDRGFALLDKNKRGPTDGP